MPSLRGSCRLCIPEISHSSQKFRLEAPSRSQVAGGDDDCIPSLSCTERSDLGSK